MGFAVIDLTLLLTSPVYRPVLAVAGAGVGLAGTSSDAPGHGLTPSALNEAFLQRCSHGFPALQAAASGVEHHHSALDIMPEMFLTETWFRLDGVQHGDIAVSIGIRSTQAPPIDAKLDSLDDFTDLFKNCPPDTFQDDYGYAIPDFARTDWFELRGRDLCNEERAILRWRAHLSATAAAGSPEVRQGATMGELIPLHSLEHIYQPACGLAGPERELVLGGIPGKVICARHCHSDSSPPGRPMCTLRQRLWMDLSGGTKLAAATSISYEAIVNCSSLEEWLSLGKRSCICIPAACGFLTSIRFTSVTVQNGCAKWLCKMVVQNGCAGQGTAGFLAADLNAEQVEKDLPRTAVSGMPLTLFYAPDSYLPPRCYPRRAGQIRNHSRVARPCSIKGRVEIKGVERACSTLLTRILILLFPRVWRG